MAPSRYPNFVLKLMNFVLILYGLCLKDDEVCVKNDISSFQNDVSIVLQVYITDGKIQKLITNTTTNTIGTSIVTVSFIYKNE